MSTTPSDTGQTTATSTIQPNTVLGLPVDTFAFILLGIGLGGSALFVVLYCLLKAHCRGKCCCCPGPQSSRGQGSKFSNVRELWEQDTRKRKQDLADAGYVNDAFNNLDELSVFTLQTDTLGEGSGEVSQNPNNNKYAHSNGISHKHKSKVKHSMSADSVLKKKRRGAPPFRYSKSNPEVFSPKEVPALQVNGEAFANSEFDQFPKNKLGSSLVRIEEEVIIEEEEDVQKDKSKNWKKFKANKRKSHLAAEMSSDGYAAEEELDVIALTPARYSPPSVLTSEVVVHVNNDPRNDTDTDEHQNDTSAPDSPAEYNTGATVGSPNDSLDDSPITDKSELTHVNEIGYAAGSEHPNDTSVQGSLAIEKPDSGQLNNLDQEQTHDPDRLPRFVKVESSENCVDDAKNILLGSSEKSAGSVNSEPGSKSENGNGLSNSEMLHSEEIIRNSAVLQDSSVDSNVTKNSASSSLTEPVDQVLKNHVEQPHQKSPSSDREINLRNHLNSSVDLKHESVPTLNRMSNGISPHMNGPSLNLDKKTPSVISKTYGVKNGGIKNLGFTDKGSSELFGLREVPFIKKTSSDPEQLSSWLHSVYVTKDG